MDRKREKDMTLDKTEEDMKDKTETSEDKVKTDKK